MIKQKHIGFIVSLVGFGVLVLFLMNAPSTGLSDFDVILLALSVLAMMSGVSIGINSAHYSHREKYTRIALPLVLLIILLGVFLKFLQLPGAGVCIILGNFFLSFSVIPVIAKNRFERWKNFTNSRFHVLWLMLGDSLGIAFIILSLTIFLQRWPGFLLFLSIGIGLTVSSIVLWNRKFEQLFKIQKDNQAKLEVQHNEIVDSIYYAKRIQSAILPPSRIVKEHLPSSFILYKPKDIVAGDFYWLEPTEKGVLFAAADCTGHGVPGAMVSVLCNNGLNRSVREHGLKDPGKILDKTREIVIGEFEKSEEEVKDGMDVALCSLQGTTLKYAGAHNPLWLIRKDTTEIQEISANKQPIGKYDQPTLYTTHSVELNKGDSFYIFSDGYADQFGGEKGKKLKTKKFKSILLSIQNETMERQRELIDEAFEEWRGSLEQLDDVCVIGVKIG